MTIQAPPPPAQETIPPDGHYRCDPEPMAGCDPVAASRAAAPQ